MSLWGFFIHFSVPDCVASVISKAMSMVRMGYSLSTFFDFAICSKESAIRF
jgi:hypothetical protein